MKILLNCKKWKDLLSGPIPEGKKNSVLINGWENIIEYWDESERRLVLANECSSKNSWEGLGDAIPGKFCNYYLHLSLEAVLPVLKQI